MFLCCQSIFWVVFLLAVFHEYMHPGVSLGIFQLSSFVSGQRNSFVLGYDLSDGMFESKCLAFFVVPNFIQTCHSHDISDTSSRKPEGEIHLLFLMFESKCLAFFVVPNFIQTCHSHDISDTSSRKPEGEIHLLFLMFESKCLAFFVVPNFIQTCHSHDFSDTSSQKPEGEIHLLFFRVQVSVPYKRMDSTRTLYSSILVVRWMSFAVKIGWSHWTAHSALTILCFTSPPSSSFAWYDASQVHKYCHLV